MFIFPTGPKLYIRYTILASYDTLVGAPKVDGPQIARLPRKSSQQVTCTPIVRNFFLLEHATLGTRVRRVILVPAN